VSDAWEGYLAALRKVLEPAYRALRYGAMTDQAATKFASVVLLFCLIEMCIVAAAILTR
jgi:hypothetical protein